LSVIIS